MAERENLPAKMAAQELTASTEKRGSLVGRGMAAVLASNQQALAKDNDARYRQARAVFDREHGKIGNWNSTNNPAVSSAFKILQQLADENYGKAYYPLSILYGEKRKIDEGHNHAQHFAHRAFDWCFANQANQDVELWRDLGIMYRLGRGVAQDYEQSLHWIRKAAEQGDASAQCQLGIMYMHNRCGVAQDAERAVYWYRKAAEQGYADAQWQLGVTYENGHGVEIDYEQAVYWFRKAAEQEDTGAQFSLGEMYDEGRGVEQDDEQAAHWYLQAAIQGNAHAQLQIGEMFGDGRGVERDDEQAEHWLLESADQGEPEAQYQLGLLLWEKGEEENALLMIESAANQEYGPAQYQIAADEGATFDVSDEECAEFFDKAFSWYEERVASGDSELRLDFALMHLDSWQAPCNKSHRANRLDGLRLLEEVASEPLVIDSDNGELSSKNAPQRRASRRLGNELLRLASKGNVSEAILWLEQAADFGDAVACVDLAKLYLCGHRGGLNSREPQPKLVEIDQSAAAHWFERGFQLGWSTSAYELGYEYLVGNHLPQDPELAEKWLLQAAGAGNLSAPSVLGEAYALGDRLRQDSEAAIYWMRLAAAHSQIACLKLASIYLDGKITPRNFDEAIKWLTLASDGGFKNQAMKLAAEKCAGGQFNATEVFATQAWLVEMAAKANETFRDEKYPACEASNAFDLGELYELGLGVEKDMEHAVTWYTHAAELGNHKAQIRLNELGIDWENT